MLNMTTPRRQIIPHGFEKHRQFVNWQIIDGEKVPCDRDGVNINAHDPVNWMSADEAMQSRFGVAFVFTRDDGLFFIDLDGHWNGSEWSDTAKRILAMFPGAAVEVSQSRTGLHIFGSGSRSIPADHKCRNQALGIEIYTHGRFVALTGHQAAGSAEIDFSLTLPRFLAEYGLERPVAVATRAAGADDGPADGYTGPQDDESLIALMLGSRGSAAAQFRDKPHVRDLWSGNIEVLTAAYPAGRVRADGCPFDRSSADAALMAHLAFWTGRDRARMERLFSRSMLYRPDHYHGKHEYLVDRLLDGATAGCKLIYDKPVNVNDQLMQQPIVPTVLRDFNQLHTSRAIDALDLPEPAFLIDRLMSAGCNLLIGKPKAGKSWMMLDISLSVATGGQFLGRRCAQGDVIYFALEDNRRRIKSRMRKLCHMRFQDIPANVRFGTMEDKIQNMDVGFIDNLRHTLSLNSSIRLVIIDTVSMIRPMQKGAESTYAYDRRSIDPFTELGGEFPNLTIILVHHTRKTETNDVYDLASGSTALTGAADNNFILGNDAENDCMILQGKGREIEEFELAVKLNAPCWDLIGSGDPKEAALNASSQVILEAMGKFNRPMTVTEMSEHFDFSRQNLTKQLKKMVQSGLIVRIGNNYLRAN